MKKIPDHYVEHDESIMSNFDGSINREVESEIKEKDMCAGYPAWNFFGTVWFDGEWNCEVRRYRIHVNTISADSLEEIMSTACALYGNQ